MIIAANMKHHTRVQCLVTLEVVLVGTSRNLPLEPSRFEERQDLIRPDMLTIEVVYTILNPCFFIMV